MLGRLVPKPEFFTRAFSSMAAQSAEHEAAMKELLDEPGFAYTTHETLSVISRTAGELCIRLAIRSIRIHGAPTDSLPPLPPRGAQTVTEQEPNQPLIEQAATELPYDQDNDSSQGPEPTND